MMNNNNLLIFYELFGAVNTNMTINIDLWILELGTRDHIVVTGEIGLPADNIHIKELNLRCYTVVAGEPDVAF